MNQLFLSNKNRLILLAFVMGVLPACRKFVQVPPPPTQIEAVKIFSNDNTAVAAVNGLYVMIGLANLNFLNGGVTLYTAVAADELYNTSPSSDIDPFFSNSILPTHTNLFNRLWRAAYNNNDLYTANAIIESLNKSASLTDSLKKQLLGEAKCLRALGYFYLVNLFGDVPLVLSTNFETNALLPRTKLDLVYQQLVTDLEEAKALLKIAYQSPNRTRVNYWTATALLARVSLYRSNWLRAEQEATALVNSGLYALNPNLAGVFTNTSSNETIWQLARDNNPTADGATFIPSSTTVKPVYALTGSLLTSFQPGDGRKTAWTAKNTIAGVDYFYPFKYRSRLATQPVEYNIFFRLAEIYLIRAEARAQLGDLLGARADLNLIRTRAGLPNTTAISQTDLITAIAKERQTELFCEMGHRWLDLKRTGKADAVLGTVKAPNWQSTDVLFPIPQSELDRNPFLVQNPGY